MKITKEALANPETLKVAIKQAFKDLKLQIITNKELLQNLDELADIEIKDQCRSEIMAILDITCNALDSNGICVSEDQNDINTIRIPMSSIKTIQTP